MTPDIGPTTAPAINERFGEGGTRRGWRVSETTDAVVDGGDAKIDPLALMVKLAALVTTLIVLLSNVVIWSVMPELLPVGMTTEMPKEEARAWMTAMAEGLCSGRGAQ